MICSLSSTFHITFPRIAAVLVRLSAHLSLWTARSFPWSCLGSSAPFALLAQASIAVPLLLATVLLLLLLVRRELTRLHILDHRDLNGEDDVYHAKEERVAVETARGGCVLYLSFYLSLSNVAHFAGATFRCVDLDPTDRISGQQRVLW